VAVEQPSEPKKDLGGTTGVGMIIAMTSTSTKGRALEVPARGESRAGRTRFTVGLGVGVPVLMAGEGGGAPVMTTGEGEGAPAPMTGGGGGINVGLCEFL